MNTSVQMSAMTKKYVEQIMESAGTININKVPSLWRNKVKNAFAEMLALGEITERQYNIYMGLPVEDEE